MIQRTTAEQLASVPFMHCLERDFVLCDRLSLLPGIDEGFQSEMLMVLFCLRGHLQLHVNDEPVQLSEGDALLCKPLSVIHKVKTDSENLTWILFYSPCVVDHVLPANRNQAHVLECTTSLKTSFDAEAMGKQIRPLLDLLRGRICNPNLPFRSHTAFHLFSLLLFEVLNAVCDLCTDGQQVDVRSKPAGRVETLFRQFVVLLGEDGGRHRTIGYYADKLCITPKHLSKVIRQKTAMRPLAFIHRHAIQQIKLDLKLTDTPIAQLADKYEFCNPSFFSQFVKAHLGMTPQDYRAQ